MVAVIVCTLDLWPSRLNSGNSWLQVNSLGLVCSKIHTCSLIAFSHSMSLFAKCQTVFDFKGSFTDASKRLTVVKPAALKDRKCRICSTVHLITAASSQKGLSLIYRLVSHSCHSFTASRVKTCWQLWTTGSTDEQQFELFVLQQPPYLG